VDNLTVSGPTSLRARFSEDFLLSHPAGSKAEEFGGKPISILLQLRAGAAPPTLLKSLHFLM
jgi:hypothetical protein